MIKYILYFTSFCMLSISYHLAAQVPIYIIAKVVEKSCTIINNDITVDMSIANGKGTVLGEPFQRTPFSIVLKDCPLGTDNAHVRLTTTNSTSSYIENQVAEGNATGYSIVVYNSLNQPLDMQDNWSDFKIDSENAQTNLNFSAAFIKTSNDASAGKFNGIASFEIVYD
ncbi:fimbrial protein [Orbus wheelerorum]|uniref:fimbrial protein n=1 Tax=Orbus wheelerorum TaxID=3074111 RepID=UPI00370D4583